MEEGTVERLFNGRLGRSSDEGGRICGCGRSGKWSCWYSIYFEWQRCFKISSSGILCWPMCLLQPRIMTDAFTRNKICSSLWSLTMFCKLCPVNTDQCGSDSCTLYWGTQFQQPWLESIDVLYKAQALSGSTCRTCSLQHLTTCVHQQELLSSLHHTNPNLPDSASSCWWWN